MEQNNKKYNVVTYIVMVVIGLFFIGTLIMSCVIGVQYKDVHPNNELSYSHIYYIEGGKEQHPFYKWVKNELGVNWVPTYIVVKDNKVIGTFKGEQNPKDFKKIVNELVADPVMNVEMTDIAIKDLDGNEKSAKEIFNNKNKYTIIEWHWVDCPDCQNQDKLYTQEIYQQNNINNFYRIYNRSDVNSIKQHHNF